MDEEGLQQWRDYFQKLPYQTLINWTEAAFVHGNARNDPHFMVKITLLAEELERREGAHA